MWKPVKLLMVATLSISLAACGGGGSSQGDDNKPPILQGKFIDSAVAGLGYSTTSGLEGLTDSGGHYKYRDGDIISFFIGNIGLGEGTAAELMTPYSIVPESTDGTTSERVTNIARLLQSLDNDDNPGNGITITASTTNVASALPKNAINLNTTAEFESTAGSLIHDLTLDNTVTSSENQLVSAEHALAHLKTSLASLAGEYAGNYSGDFADVELSYFQFTISETGEIAGTAESSSAGTLILAGTVDHHGNLHIAMSTSDGIDHGAIEAYFGADRTLTGNASLTDSTISPVRITEGGIASSNWDSLKWDRDIWN